MSDQKIILQGVQVGDRITVIHDGGWTRPQAVAPPAAPKTNAPIPEYGNLGTRWAYWGDDDLLPTKMREKIEAVPIAGATLDKKIRMMLGNGLVYYKSADLRKGPNVERHYDREIEDWLADFRIQEEWLPAQAADFVLPFNCFSEVILSNSRKEIAGLFHVSAEHSRLSVANKSNQIDWMIISKYFPFLTAQDDKSRVAMPLYKWYDRENFFNNLSGFKFGWHTRFPTPGLIYYARAWWLGLFKADGWLEVSAQVPKIVSSMQRNQIRLRYVIEIPETYFMVRHPDWTTYTSAKRQEIIDQKIAEINQYLSGTDNVSKSLAYVFKENEISGTAIGKINIVAVDDKAKEGVWVPDSYAADAQIVQGLGMDPSQIGLAPEGGKMGAGSGSDKRESYNLMITLNTPEQRLLLEPLNFISRFNKWGVTFAIDHITHTTTNNQESGLESSPQSTNINPAK